MSLGYFFQVHHDQVVCCALHLVLLPDLQIGGAGEVILQLSPMAA